MCGTPEDRFDWHQIMICQHCGKKIEFQDGKYINKKTNNGWFNAEDQKFVCDIHTYEEVWEKKDGSK